MTRNQLPSPSNVLELGHQEQTPAMKCGCGLNRIMHGTPLHVTLLHVTHAMHMIQGARTERVGDESRPIPSRLERNHWKIPRPNNLHHLPQPQVSNLKTLGDSGDGIDSIDDSSESRDQNQRKSDRNLTDHIQSRGESFAANEK